MRWPVSKAPYWTVALCVMFLSPVVLAYTQPPDPLKLVPDKEPRSETGLREHARLLRHQQDDPKLWMELGLDYLELATQDNWTYLDQAALYFDKVLARFPQSASALMLRGRVQGARALNNKPSSLTRLRWARQGFVQMDKAIALDPRNTYLRLLRGEASLMSHPILGRGSSLDEDAARVETFISQEAASLSNFAKGRLHLFLGNYYQRIKQSTKARDHWQTAISLAAESQLAQEAHQRLQGSFKSLGYEY